MNGPQSPETIDVLSVQSPAENREVDTGSSPKVGFVEGRRPCFDDETGALLRSRLLAATLILGVLLTAIFL
jgi:hypothetical protein